jgi:aryl-alcohol dehydrogenase-like predicted oxidoreductase
MLWRIIEAEVVPASTEVGVSQIVWSPVAQGVLTGKYQPGQPLPAGSRATDKSSGADFGQRWLADDTLLERVQQLRPLAEKAGLSLAQLAVAWVLQNQNVAAAIIGASRPEQVAENTKAAGVRLDEQLMADIDQVLGDAVVRDPSITATRSPADR